MTISSALRARALSICVCLLAFAASSCGEDELLVQVQACGDVNVPAEVDTLRVEVLNDKRELTDQGIIELLSCEGDERVKTLPQSIEVGSSTTGKIWVALVGIKDGVEVVRYEQTADVEEGEPASLTMGLTRDCLGFTCPDGQTCVDGDCIIVESGNNSSACTGGEASAPEADCTARGGSLLCTSDSGGSCTLGTPECVCRCGLAASGCADDEDALICTDSDDATCELGTPGCSCQPCTFFRIDGGPYCPDTGLPG